MATKWLSGEKEKLQQKPLKILIRWVNSVVWAWLDEENLKELGWFSCIDPKEILAWVGKVEIIKNWKIRIIKILLEKNWILEVLEFTLITIWRFNTLGINIL